MGKLKEFYIYEKFEDGTGEYWDEFKSREEAHAAWKKRFKGNPAFVLVVMEEKPWGK